ncbi:CSS-motif domain-containing protein [Klebsiella pneumoniae subsp. pneumoniae]|nr:CSS-motif domain-containing protein [Klebsiella pneumoniae subsp. pneumoniae]
MIKDVGYIIKGELACSALWGSLRPTLSLEHFDKNGLQQGRSVAFWY